MSVEYIKRLAGPYVGDGTGQKTFSFGFLSFEESDVYVAVAASSDSEPSDLQQGTDYTVSMNADQSATPGGTITLTSETGLAKDAVLVIGSAVDYTQTLDLTNYTRFAPERITTELDRIVVMIQQIVELLGRVVQVPPTSSISPSDLFFQLLNAAESAAQSAEDAAASLAACEQIRQLIQLYSWDIPHIVDSLRDVEDYPYDGLFAVGGFGNPGHKGQNISNRYVKAEGSTELRTLGERFADVVNVRDFGAKGDGTTDDTAAIQAALDSGSKHVFFPMGDYLLHSDSVSSGEGACLTLTATHSGIRLLGSGASVLISKTNKLQLICINGADDVGIDGFYFDNSANGLLQNQVKGSGQGAPDGGIALNGNNACAAVALFNGADISVTNCVFDTFNVGIYYIANYNDISQLGGHLSSKWNTFKNCCFGNLLDTPKSYEIVGCYNENNVNSINADGSIDPGHLLYVTDRPGAVPENGIVSDITDTNGENSSIKIRKGETVSVSNVAVFNSGKGLEIVTVKNGVVSNCSIKLKEVATLSAQAGIELDDCGRVHVANSVVDIRGFDAWGIRVRKDTSTDTQLNSGWSLLNCTIITDYTNEASRGKAPITVENQSNFSITKCRHYDVGSAKNTRPFIYLNNSHYGVVDTPILFFSGSSAVADAVGLVSGSSHNRVFLSRLCYPQLAVNSSTRIYFDSGEGEDNIFAEVSSYLPNGTVEAPALCFAAETGTGIYRETAGRIGFAVNGEKVMEAFSGSLRPGVSGETNLGYPSALWSQLYAASATINTSDSRFKTCVSATSDDLLDAWEAVPFHTFQFTDAVEKKGADAARLHVGVVAQEVQQAFALKGLDATRYGLFCHDAWEDEYETVEVVDQPEVFDENGEVVSPAITHTEQKLITAAGDRFGIRYEEALCLEAAYQRRRADRLEERLAALEKRMTIVEAQ